MCFFAVFAEPDNATEPVSEIIAAVNESETEDESGVKESDVLPKEDNGSMAVQEQTSSEPDKAVSLTAVLEPVGYIDKNVNKAQCDKYTLFSGDPEGNMLDGTESEVWYVLTGQFNATADWIVEGNVNIILTDGSSCNTNGHCIDLKDKAELTVYGQEKGTGLFSIYHSPADGAKEAALDGPSPLIEDKNMHWHTELGSFSLYGRNVNIESTGYYAAHLMDLTVMGRTLTAKTVESYTTISMPTRTLVLY